MADWSRRHESTRYRFVRVSRSSGMEVGQIRSLKGGSITRNDDTLIKESAEVGVVGEVDLGPDLVRVYMAVTWPDGTASSTALGTFIPVVPGRTVRAGYSTATMKLYGRLQELVDDQFPEPVTVVAGENAVGRAVEVCRAAGLEVVADESDYALSSTRVYGVGSENQETATKLAMVNDLLALAGFRSAETDPMGRVVLRRYRAPSELPPVWSFEEGPSARFESKMEEEADYTQSANHVVVLYGTSDGKSVAAEAWDRDPASPLSTVNRGRVITKVYTYSELPPGDGDSERQEYASAKARELLATSQSVVHRVTVTHAYAPVAIGDAVSLSYPSGGVSGKFQVRTQTLKLAGGCPTSAELRRYDRRGSDG